MSATQSPMLSSGRSRIEDRLEAAARVERHQTWREAQAEISLNSGRSDSKMAILLP